MEYDNANEFYLVLPKYPFVSEHDYQNYRTLQYIRTLYQNSDLLPPADLIKFQYGYRLRPGGTRQDSAGRIYEHLRYVQCNQQCDFTNVISSFVSNVDRYDNFVDVDRLSEDRLSEDRLSSA